MGCKGALSCLQVNSQALIFVNLPLLMYLSNDPRPGGMLGSPPRPGAAPRSQAFAFAAGRAQEAGLVQSKGFARQQRLALQAGKVLLVPGHPFCLLVVLREDDLQGRQTDNCSFPPSLVWRTSPTPPTKPIGHGGQALGTGQ